MGREDWYRRETWTPEDQAEFFLRLNRGRKAYYKASHCRVQAVYLEKTGDPPRIEAAVGLLRLVLSNWPDQTTELASVHWQLGTCFAKLGRLDEAFASLRDSVAARRLEPLFCNPAFLDFGWLAVTHRRSDLYAEAIALLQEFGPRDGRDSTFPRETYRHAAVCALIADETGQAALAGDWARCALEAAGQRVSGSWKHPEWGVLQEPPDWQVHERLRTLAAHQ